MNNISCIRYINCHLGSYGHSFGSVVWKTNWKLAIGAHRNLLSCEGPNVSLGPLLVALGI